jgi:hypothetical protein
MIASVCMAVSGLANAVPITHNDYTLNPTTNIVTHTDGTDWLQWDVTIGESINSALSKYASEGWMLASNAQMAGLFTDFGWGSSVQEDDTVATIGTYSASADESAMDEFIELFGTTYSNQVRCSQVDILCQRRTSALFGSDLDDDGFFQYAHVHSDYLLCGRGACYESPDFARIVSDSYRSIDADRIMYDAGFGVALTRVVDVPAPSTILIFALGLMGLASRRFIKTSLKSSFDLLYLVSTMVCLNKPM